MSADENVPIEKVLNCRNVAEINILENTFLIYEYMRRPPVMEASGKWHEAFRNLRE